MTKNPYIHNYYDFVEKVKFGITAESIYVDFKQTLDVSNLKPQEKKKKAKEYALDICQFANTWGGVILLGIVESENKITGQKVARNAININEHEKIIQFINDSVICLIHPKNIRIISNTLHLEETINILAINVYPLASSLGCVYDNQPPYASIYPYRTEYGKKYLQPSEVEGRMSDSNRDIEIKLIELSSMSLKVKIYPSIEKQPLDKPSRVDSGHENIIFKEIYNYEYRININGIDINIPFGLTSDVWRTEKNEIGIFLKTKIVLSSNRKFAFFDL